MPLSFNEQSGTDMCRVCTRTPMAVSQAWHTGICRSIRWGSRRIPVGRGDLGSDMNSRGIERTRKLNRGTQGQSVHDGRFFLLVLLRDLMNIDVITLATAQAVLGYISGQADPFKEGRSQSRSIDIPSFVLQRSFLLTGGSEPHLCPHPSLHTR